MSSAPPAILKPKFRIRRSAASIFHNSSSTGNLRLTIGNADHRGKIRTMRIKKETLQTIQIIHESPDIPLTCRTAVAMVSEETPLRTAPVLVHTMVPYG